MNKKFRIAIILVVILLVTVLVSAGCKVGIGKRTSSIKVYTDGQSITYLPHYIALAKGYYQEQDLKVSLSPLTEGADLSTLPKNETVLMTSDPNTILNLNNQTPWLAIGQQANDTGYYLLSRNQETPFNWLDLKGKNVIGGADQWWPEILLEYLVKKNNLRPQWDLTLIKNIPLPMASGAFQSGTGSYLLTQEPTASKLEKAGLGRLATPLAMGKWKIPQGVILVQPESISPNPQSLQKLVNGIYKAQLWMSRHNPQEVATAVQPYFPQVPKDQLREIIQRLSKRGFWSNDPLLNKESLELIQDIMNQDGRAGKRISFARWADNRFAQEALQSVKLEEEKKEK